MSYNYIDGKNRVIDVLNNNAEIEEKTIPKDDSNFTYNNGIRCYIGSIFVDIIDSKKLIQKESDIVVAKVLRSFTSEVIDIMNSSENMRHIGIRGDCVYGVFSSPNKEDIYELQDLTVYINTLLKMLNKIFLKNNYPIINVGIGMAVKKDLVIKAGKKGTGINDRIWIGEAVVDACVIADKAGRNGYPPIGYNSVAYCNFIEKLNDNYSGAKSWFQKKYNPENCKYEYYANLSKTEFKNWIDENL